MNLSVALSPAAKSRIKDLSGPRPRKFAEALVSTWAVIVLAVAGALYFESVWVTALAIVVIATRQNLLALLLHEQVHHLGIRGRFGDSLANLLVAYPLLALSVEGYSDIHLRHHRYYLSPKDPDFHLKKGDEWLFPMRPAKLVGLFLLDLTGISFLKYTFRPQPSPADGPVPKRQNPSPRWLRPLFFIALAAVLTVVGGWTAFLLLWILPLLSVFPAIVRWSAICEHIYGREDATAEETTPIIIRKRWEKLLLPNMNFTLHIYHHYFPGVSYSNLPAVHDIFVEENLVDSAMVFDGYREFLPYVLNAARGFRPVEAKADPVG